MVNSRAFAAPAAVLGTCIQLVLVLRAPGYGFIGAGLAALGGMVLLVAMLYQLDFAADCWTRSCRTGRRYLYDDDLELVTRFIDALVTKTRLKTLATNAS